MRKGFIIVIGLPLLLAVFFLLLRPLSAEAAEKLDGLVTAASEAPTSTPPAESIFQRLSRGFSLHRENYLLPLTWGNRAAKTADAELKFQLSFKQQLYDGLYFAYTQKSFWRILDGADSRPFRETNYNPEIFYRLQGKTESGVTWGGDLGVEHESNGAREPTSRSWNRLYLAPSIGYQRLWAELKIWYRLGEEVKESPEDPAGDENPDIEKFYGYGELRLAYVSRKGHRAAVMGRYNFATNKGGLLVDYGLATGVKNLYVYSQLWTGYGESLIDYNRSITRYGVGILIRQ